MTMVMLALNTKMERLKPLEGGLVTVSTLGGAAIFSQITVTDTASRSEQHVPRTGSQGQGSL